MKFESNKEYMGNLSLHFTSSVAEPDLQIRGEPGHSDPEIKGRGRSEKEFFFGPLGLSLV